MWDNRGKKTNPKAPDFKCRDRGCDGVIWPPKKTAPNGPALVSPTKSISQVYTESLSFVLKTVVPAIANAGISVGDQTVAAITATIFIARRKEER